MNIFEKELHEKEEGGDKNEEKKGSCGRSAIFDVDGDTAYGNIGYSR